MRMKRFWKAIVGVLACGIVLGACSEGEDAADFNSRMLGSITDFKTRLLSSGVSRRVSRHGLLS